MAGKHPNGTRPGVSERSCLTAGLCGPCAQAAVDAMSKAHTEEAARQSAADERVRTAKVKPRYEFYGGAHPPER